MRCVTLALCAALAATAAAQERDRTYRAGLPRDVAREAARLFNEPAALRTTNRVDIDEDRVVDGDMSVINGPAIISGHVRGRVLAINSDVVLARTARIDGDLIVVGGEVEGRHAAYIGGEIRIYRQRLQYAYDGDRIVPERTGTAISEETGWWRRWERTRYRSGSKLQIATAGPYNRVEGLPIKLGPQVFYNGPSWSARLDAYAVLRTETSFDGSENDIGHTVNSEMRLGRRGGVLVGAQLFNVVESTESWQLSDLEAGLSAFVMRRDYRDYYGRHGARVRAGFFLRDGADLWVSYGSERWASRAAEGPWTLFRSNVGWRPNPQFDDGRVHLINSTLRLDTRNDEDDPGSGWYALADVEHGFANVASYAPRSEPVGLSAGPRSQYARGFLDMRRYNRVSPGAQLNLRVVAGGWLNGDPLPLQRRFAVDGPGALPGFDFRSTSSLNVLTCTTGAYVSGLPGQCDRMALAQVEYRGDLHFDFFSDWDDDFVGDHSDGVWVFFADAGRGWLVGNAASTDSLTFGRNEIPALSTFETDLGFGLDFDIIGVYAAKAMSASEPVNFFVRIRHRF